MDRVPERASTTHPGCSPIHLSNSGRDAADRAVVEVGRVGGAGADGDVGGVGADVDGVRSGRESMGRTWTRSSAPPATADGRGRPRLRVGWRRCQPLHRLAQGRDSLDLGRRLRAGVVGDPHRRPNATDVGRTPMSSGRPARERSPHRSWSARVPLRDDPEPRPPVATDRGSSPARTDPARGVG